MSQRILLCQSLRGLKKSETSTGQLPAGECVPVPTATTPRKGSPRIMLPVQETNIEAVRSFMRECLVPILAKEFLRQRSASSLERSSEAFASVSTSEATGRRDGR